MVKLIEFFTHVTSKAPPDLIGSVRRIIDAVKLGLQDRTPEELAEAIEDLAKNPPRRMDPDFSKAREIIEHRKATEEAETD